MFQFFFRFAGRIPFLVNPVGLLLPPAMTLAAVRVLQWRNLNPPSLVFRSLQHSSSFLANTSLSQRTMSTRRRSSSTNAASNAIPEPRLSRTKESRTFAGMHAFPGGNFDGSQDGPATEAGSIRMTAVRETFEETGILLASPGQSGPIPDTTVLLNARKAIHSRNDPYTFPAFLQEHNLVVQEVLEKLIPFSQWITPASAKARFHTHFFVAFLDELPNTVPAISDVSAAAQQEIDPSSPTATLPTTEPHRDVLPTDDGKVEVLETYFQHPAKILETFERGDISLMPPQFYLLTTLKELLEGSAESSLQSSRSRFRDIAGQAFGARVFNPRFGGTVEGKDGVKRSVLMYEGDEAYNDPPSATESSRRWHRSLVTFREGRIATIQLIRDIDVSKPPTVAKL